MGERQPGKREIGFGERVDLDHGASRVDQVSVSELGTLGIASGARGVDDGAHVIRSNPSQPGDDLVDVLGRLGDPLRHFDVHARDGLERLAGLQLGGHLGVGHDRHDRFAVGRDRLRHVRHGARVDRNRHCAGGLDSEIAVDPFEAVLAHQDDVVAGLYARLHEA